MPNPNPREILPSLGPLAQLLSAPRRLRQRLASERGQTLMEVMIAASLTLVVASAMLLLVSLVFNSQTQATAMSDQRFSAQLVKDFLYSRSSSSTVSDIGLVSGGRVSPVSYAGDQVIFKDGSGNCYRVFYVARRKELRAASEHGGCNQIAPVRGPNQELAGGGYVESDHAAADFDPVLDNLDGQQQDYGYPSFVLAGGVSQDNTALEAQQPGPGLPLPFFSYRGDPLQATYSPDGQADSNSTNPWYDDPAQAQDTQELTFSFVLDSPTTGPGTSVGVRPEQETIYLNS